MRSSYLDYAMSVIVGRGAARRARRPQARPPARPLGDARVGDAAEPAVQEVRQRRRLRDGQLPPARRLRDLRHARPDGAALLAALPARRRPGQLRLARRRSRRRRCATRSAGCRGSRPRCSATSTWTRSTSGRTTTSRARSRPSLPSRFPNLLVNGSTGIAVGHGDEHAAAPPRRVDRRGRAADRQARRERRGPDEARQGPRLPDRRRSSSAASGIRDAYRTGRGRIVMRARAHVEELRGGKSAIIVTELPYGVKKGGDSGVIKKIADLVNDKVITEVSDLADHSDKTGMRDPDRAEARRDPAGRPQQALQAHRAPDDVRLQRRRARRRRPEDAVAARARPALPRLPARDRHAPLEVRAPPGGEARAHPRRAT